ncbi:MAG: zf-TFIIB domain-containing protein [Gammaproteobacteria bacterium]
MQCPKCAAPMQPLSFASVEVDRCTGCKGLWFDATELEELEAFDGSEVIDAGAPAAHGDEGRRTECPKCRTAMLRMVHPRQSHIWYESCPTCYGAFLDAGEFRDLKHETLADFFRDLFTPERR